MTPSSEQNAALDAMLNHHKGWRARFIGALRPLEMPFLVQSLADERDVGMPLWTKADLLDNWSRARIELKRLWEAGFCEVCDELQRTCREWLALSTEASFIRSEVNGRQSRRVVLLVLFISDVIGALSWAFWCDKHTDSTDTRHFNLISISHACNSLQVNRFLGLALVLPIEGVVLFLAGWWLWSFWSDFLLLPTLLGRLLVFDVLLWRSSATLLFSDVLWFVALAVMCRVHSAALAIFVSVMTCTCGLLVTSDQLDKESMIGVRGQEQGRIGHYGVAALFLVALAYFLDEQRRLRAHGSLLMLQDRNSALADGLIRWKVLVGDIENTSVEMSNSGGPNYAYAWSRNSSGVSPRALQERMPSGRPPSRNDLHPAFAVARRAHWEEELPMQAQLHPWAPSTLAPTTKPRPQAGLPSDPHIAHMCRLEAADRQHSPMMDILDVIE